MANEVPYAIFIRKEDFSADQQAVYNQLSNYLPSINGFKPLNTYVNGSGTQNNQNHKKQDKDYPSFNQQDLNVVDAYLDKKIAHYFGYTK